MTPKDLQDRTKQFALRIMKLAEFLEKHSIAKFIGRQIFRSGHRLPQIIALHAGQNQPEILFPNSVLLLKKPTKLPFGWNY
jgi:hypothetical protein